MSETPKKFMRLEDNEDGTLTITYSCGDLYGGALSNTTIVMPGTLQSFFEATLNTMTPEQLEGYGPTKEATIIPNDAELA